MKSPHSRKANRRAARTGEFSDFLFTIVKKLQNL